MVTDPGALATLEKVLSNATVEERHSVPEPSIPSQFYDLKYSALDIYEALRVWSAGEEPSAHPIFGAIAEQQRI